MVKSYSKTANHNMRRPVVKEDVVRYMRNQQKPNEGYLAELADFAHRENIPIIQHEVVAYFRFLMQTLQPKNILEIGTAIGFSTLLMAENAPGAKITTLDRNPEMIAFAKDNFAKYDTRHQITLVEGDAVDTLSSIEGEFDFVFMDSAKSKYIVFLPEVLEHLKVGGVVVFDDVFQGGDIVKPIEEVRRGQRTIYRGLQRLFDATLDNPDLTATLVPLSDGLLMIRKNAEDVTL
ncbi:O-methyltransferase [Streptococcus alactolyticus]|uniref:tRNA 5-hydroxyuridine methyltransferase n=1 Tax=Streptococcus alactolyticus TaxID=29389 RepID=A0A6N7WMP7_STRAY|nr:MULTISPECIES: O-methyltransferase [Streptococcus]MDE2587610.1 O-methyltransferase [Lactobacillales bacterium]MBD9119584.1 O-methyltransferase [Streptococcus sp.]MCF2665664.1 O-methyltransferase [Streptococcus alactolyticus]MCF2678030.1 O-methyltransferase [Streptococcus alactolyticus]MCI6904050.1 O-methyltransferase [Streptococcus alactolyticus]